MQTEYELVIVEAHLVPKGGIVGTFGYVEGALWDGDVDNALVTFDGELHESWDYAKKSFMETNPDQYWAFLDKYFDGGKPSSEWDNRTELTARCEIGIYLFKVVSKVGQLNALIHDLIDGLSLAFAGDLPLLREFAIATQERKSTLIALWDVSAWGNEDDFDFSTNLIGELAGISAQWVNSVKQFEVQVNERPV